MDVDDLEYNQPNKTWKYGHVYLIDYGDKKTFKIGYTKLEPMVRLSQIARGNVVMPMHLVMSCETLTNAQYLENIIHMALDDCHAKGEWFRLDLDRLIHLYQTLQFFGCVELYDRWFEVVPDNYLKYFSNYDVTANLPIFESGLNPDSQQELIAEAMTGIHA